MRFFNIVNLVCNVFKKRVSVRTKNKESMETMSNVPLNMDNSTLAKSFYVNFDCHKAITGLYKFATFFECGLDPSPIIHTYS